jgi:hypothetical protein
VGPVGEVGSRGKEVALALLDAILGAGRSIAPPAPAVSAAAAP